jgi:hypothetical protein
MGFSFHSTVLRQTRRRMLERKPHHQRVGARGQNQRKTRRREPAGRSQRESFHRETHAKPKEALRCWPRRSLARLAIPKRGPPAQAGGLFRHALIWRGRMSYHARLSGLWHIYFQDSPSSEPSQFQLLKSASRRPAAIPSPPAAKLPDRGPYFPRSLGSLIGTCREVLTILGLPSG